jgi:hypothetical protein
MWNYTVTAYTTPVSPATMTATWATNRGPNPGTVVFNGTVNCPAAAPAFPTPNPFALTVAFTTPYAYATASGHLLLEIEGFDTANQFDNWSPDAELFRTATTGSLQTVLPGCTGSTAEAMTISVGTANLVVGGNADVAFKWNGNFTVFLNWIGASNNNQGGVPLPLDLTPLGAPGCSIGASLNIIQASAAGPFLWPIPNDPSLEDAVLWTQGAGLAASANALGLVTSQVHQFRIGGPNPPPSPFQSVFRQSNMNLPDGTLSTLGFYGVVTQFTGAFN